jgi:hypothetical protein
VHPVKGEIFPRKRFVYKLYRHFVRAPPVGLIFGRTAFQEPISVFLLVFEPVKLYGGFVTVKNVEAFIPELTAQRRRIQHKRHAPFRFDQVYVHVVADYGIGEYIRRRLQQISLNRIVGKGFFRGMILQRNQAPKFAICKDRHDKYRFDTERRHEALFIIR